jgi:hypothetical protein
LDKLVAARSQFTERGMMQGITLSYTAMLLGGEEPQPLAITSDTDKDDHGAVTGPRVLSGIELTTTAGTFMLLYDCIFLTHKQNKDILSISKALPPTLVSRAYPILSAIFSITSSTLITKCLVMTYLSMSAHTSVVVFWFIIL